MIRRALILALALLAVAPVASEAITIVDVTTSTSTSPFSQTGRLVQDGVPSGCSGPLKFAPSLTSTGSTFLHRNHSLRSRILERVCITVDITTACTGLFSVGYLGGFNPADPLANYAADMGQSSGTPIYSFVVPAGSPFNVIVHEVSACASTYRLVLSSRGPWADAVPAVTGQPALGSVLTGADATWEGTPAVTRAWQRCDPAGANCTDIPGATAATYTVTEADLGGTLRFMNRATDADATHSSQSGMVEPFIPFDVRAAESLGVGDRVQNGIFIRNGVESRCGVQTSAPTILQPASSYLYDVFAVASLLNEPVCLSARTDPSCVAGVSPTIYDPAFAPASGLAANYAGNSGMAFAQTAHASVPLLAGGTREVTVYSGMASTACDAYALTLGADAPFATARPALSGAALVGEALTATPGSWSGTPALAYSWLRCDAAGAGCAEIPGATGAGYTPTAADAGSTLRARVTATQGPSVSSDSDASAPVRDATAPVGSVRLASRNLRKALKSGRVPLRVRCDEACSATVALTVSRKLARRLGLRRALILARAGGELPAARTTTLRARLTRAARRRPVRRALRARRSVSFRLVASFADAAGNRSTLRPKATLKRPRARR